MSHIDETKAHHDTETGDDSYLASLSDLMVGMLFIFIIMLMAFALSYTNATGAANSQREALECLLTKNQTQLSDLLGQISLNFNEQLGNDTRIQVDLSKDVLRMEDSVLFDQGKSELRPKGKEAVQALAKILSRVLPNAKSIIEGIYVEGHTDSDPVINGSNWKLSTDRAINTFQELISAHQDLNGMRNARDEKIFGVSGYAEQRPITSNATAAGKERNRRIDIRFTLRVPTSEEVQRAMDGAAGGKGGC